MPFYIPKSQITTNLYTNGNEYMIATTSKPYTGYYYETSKGKKYTGKVPNNRSSVLLIDLVKEKNTPEGLKALEFIEYKPNHDSEYNFLSKNSLMINEHYSNLIYGKGLNNLRAIPQPYHSYPTEEQLKIGSCVKYFAKKTTENTYFEISKETYEKFEKKDKNVALELYEVLSTPWYVGQQEYLNEDIVNNIEKNNKWINFNTLFGTYPQQTYNNTPPDTKTISTTPSTPTNSSSSPSSGGGGGY
jgi:hypothetical protein